jgi:3'(2'), 5'-bisphosphate nucleotidase
MRVRLEMLAIAAGQAIMRIAAGGVAAEAKADDTPVTAADREAEAIILAGLRQHYPDIPVVAEEEYAAGLTTQAPGDAFFLVDPLDGTREFVAGRPDYTVNIALVQDGVPVIGVVHAPARNRLWSGSPGEASQAGVDAGGRIIHRRPMRVVAPSRPPRIVASRSHNTPETDAFIARHPGAAIVSVGSSLKFCLVAAGEADLYPRFGRTMEWDTAAGDAILRAAGGMTRTLDGEPMRYGKAPVFENPHFLASA